MPLRYEPILSVALCRQNPDALVVFGDNLAGWGKGGQAVIRDEPNAVGIPTKKAPRMRENAFLSDADLYAVRAEAAPIFARLRAHLEAGGTVIWPTNGIGTGLAELPARAPRIWAMLERARVRLVEVGGQEREGRTA